MTDTGIKKKKTKSNGIICQIPATNNTDMDTKISNNAPPESNNTWMANTYKTPAWSKTKWTNMATKVAKTQTTTWKFPYPNQRTNNLPKSTYIYAKNTKEKNYIKKLFTENDTIPEKTYMSTNEKKG